MSDVFLWISLDNRIRIFKVFLFVCLLGFIFIFLALFFFILLLQKKKIQDAGSVQQNVTGILYQKKKKHEPTLK